MDAALAPYLHLAGRNARRLPCRVFLHDGANRMVEKESPAPFDPLILQSRRQYSSTALDEVLVGKARECEHNEQRKGDCVKLPTLLDPVAQPRLK